MCRTFPVFGPIIRYPFKKKAIIIILQVEDSWGTYKMFCICYFAIVSREVVYYVTLNLNDNECLKYSDESVLKLECIISERLICLFIKNLLELKRS